MIVFIVQISCLKPPCNHLCSLTELKLNLQLYQHLSMCLLVWYKGTSINMMFGM